ncbi:MAG: type II secretion system protein, partial [Sedimentisphaerales bacterium]|nr:type II secretion system protein [Sedimentisphaerales bacterium]
MNANKKMRRKGFTIVELLTVMGVIAILISLLVPALALVRDFSKEIQQSAQFHSIDVGLEMYKTEFGDYPESSDNDDLYDASKCHPDDPTPYGGANKLAEAMVGLDMLG